MEDAAAIDAKYDAGESITPLCGLPLAVKDAIDVLGWAVIPLLLERLVLREEYAQTKTIVNWCLSYTEIDQDQLPTLYMPQTGVLDNCRYPTTGSTPALKGNAPIAGWMHSPLLNVTFAKRIPS